MTEIFAACSNCVYFRPGARSVERDGVCRRSPPTQLSEEKPSEQTAASSSEFMTETFTMTEYHTYSGWPDVSAHDWCGDHKLGPG